MLQNEYFLTSQQFKMADIKIIQISCDSTSLMSSQKKKEKKKHFKKLCHFLLSRRFIRYFPGKGISLQTSRAGGSIAATPAFAVVLFSCQD